MYLFSSSITSSTLDCYNVFLLISQSLSLKTSPLFILSLPSHFYPSHEQQIACVNPYPISTLLKSLGVAVRLKCTVQISLPY